MLLAQDTEGQSERWRTEDERTLQTRDDDLFSPKGVANEHLRSILAWWGILGLMANSNTLMFGILTALSQEGFQTFLSSVGLNMKLWRREL